MSNAHPGRILPQDVLPQDGSGDMLTALPVSQAEIDELLYGDDRPPQERVERLKELAAQMRTQEPGDFGDGDPRALLLEIDEAVVRLSGDIERDPAEDEATMDDDPLNHRETLSPDSDELDEIEEEDEESIEEDIEPMDDDDVLDPEEWGEDK